MMIGYLMDLNSEQFSLKVCFSSTNVSDDSQWLYIKQIQHYLKPLTSDIIKMFISAYV